jgi:hypothetical protein
VTSSLVDVVERHVLYPGTSHDGLWLGPNFLLQPGTQPRCHRIFFTESDRIGGDSMQKAFVFSPAQAMPGELGMHQWRQTWLRRRMPTNLQRRYEAGGYEYVPSLPWGWHQTSNTGLAVGGVVRHRNGQLDDHVRHLAIAYATYNPRRERFTRWDSFQIEVDGEPKPSISPCQALELPGGDVLLPFSVVRDFDGWNSVRWVGTVRCSFNGRKLVPEEVGNLQTHAVPRGFVEPSIAACGKGFLMTLRAQDGHGHVASSGNGLQWGEPRPWCWDDGTPIPMDQTMTKFLSHSDGLYLVYTRISPEGEGVFRYRAPLYMARVDARKHALIRNTERVVFPSRGYPMGNFRVYTVSPAESWITVPEWDRTGRHVNCDILLARVLWNTPNQSLATGPFPLGG